LPLFIAVTLAAALAQAAGDAPAEKEARILYGHAMGVVPAGKEVRVLHGPLGPYAGDDFPCEEKNVFKDSPWARGACMLSCRPRDNDGAHACTRAVELCRSLPHCATVNVNVEGTIATLKRETALSAKTSKGKQIVFSQDKLNAAIGRDKACTLRDVWTGKDGPDGACMLNCFRLNCTAATALCYAREDCVAIDIGFGFAGRGAVARLRFSP
jgi:hypothetical protein